MVSRLHLHMMDRGGEEAQGAVNSDKDLLARLMDYDLDQRLQKVYVGKIFLAGNQLYDF